MKRALVMTGLTTILIAIGLTASAYALIRHASPGGDRTWRDTAAGLEGGHAAPEVSGQRTSADAHRVRDLGIGPLGVVLEHQGLALGAGKALSGLSQGLAGCDTPARTRSVRRKWPFAERPWLIAYWPVSGLTGQNWMNEPAGGGEREPRSGVAFWQATGQRLTIYTADRLVERSAGGFSCDGAPSVSAWRFSRRTGWTQNLQTPLRRFLRTETGGAVVLLTATLAALAWANVDPAGMRRRGTRC